MAKQDDVLSSEVAIAGKLEADGLTLKAKSRAVAAIDRLVGSVADWPAAYFEGRAAKRRLKDEHERRLMEAQALIAEQQMPGHHELGVILINDVLKDQARKKANAACVAAEAIEELKALPAPDASDGQATASEPDAAIDEDWMNQFTRYAEDASSEQLQQIWGRVLAGEVRKPGSFSRQALRFIAELDRETAEDCELLGKHVVGDWVLKDEKWNEGERFLISIELQRLGLIEGVGIGGPSRKFVIHPSGASGVVGKQWGVLVKGNPGVEVTFEIFTLTRLGRQVMSLVTTADEPACLRELAVKMNKAGLHSIVLGRAVRQGAGWIFAPPLETLWEAPQA